MSYKRSCFKSGYQPKTEPKTPPTPPTGGSSASVDKRCGCKNCTCKEKSKKEVRTNYDDIVNYTIDQMAQFLANLAGGGEVRKKAFEEWLGEEAKDER